MSRPGQGQVTLPGTGRRRHPRRACRPHLQFENQFVVVFLLSRFCILYACSESTLVRARPPVSRHQVGGWGRVVPRLVRSKRGQNVHFRKTKRGLVSTPRAWSIHMGHFTITRPPPGAMLLPRRRDQAVARSNSRESLVSVSVVDGRHVDDGGDQAARSPLARHRHHSQRSSYEYYLCCLGPSALPARDDHHSVR